jgi:hypothetical protein
MLTLKIKNKINKRKVKTGKRKLKTGKRKVKTDKRKVKTNKRKVKTNKRKVKKLKGGSNPLVNLYRGSMHELQNFTDKIMGNSPLESSPYPYDQPAMKM